MPSTKKTIRAGIAACLVAIDKSSADIQLFPAGRFDAPLGALLGKGPWQLDGESAGRLIAAVAGRGNDILIDYEHQSLTAAQNGHAAPAAGWITPTSLQWRADGLYAIAPDWKEKAAAMIAADEYRYLSPVFTYDKTTGTPTNLISVALTNTPAIGGMAAVSLAAAMAGIAIPQETPMDLTDLMERLCYLLNLPLTTTLTEMATELDKLKAMLGEGNGGAAATSLPDLLAAKNQEIAALKTAAPDPAKYVPVEALLAVQQQKTQADQASREQEVAALIAAHPAVITPALEPWAKELGRKDLDKLKELIHLMGPIAALSSTQTRGQAPAAAAQATDADVVVMKALGLSADQFATGKPKE